MDDLGEGVALNTTDTESTALIDEAVLQDREPVLLISHELSQTSLTKLMMHRVAHGLDLNQSTITAG